MEKISPYYSHFIKGAIGIKSKSLIKIRDAAENFEKCLSYKKTEEAYRCLLTCYYMLNESDKYEKIMLEAIENNYSSFYSSAGLYYARNAAKHDKAKALSWFERGMKIGDAKSYSDLANLYLYGCKYFEKDLKEAEKVLLEGLKLNDNQWNGYFNYFLGCIRFDDKKYAEAAIYFKDAAKEKYSLANYNLAHMYKDGLGVEKNNDLYIEHLIKHLCVESALELGGIYITGELVEKDEFISFSYFDYAAKHGSYIGAFMCAAFVLDKKNYDEKLLNSYLDIAFKNSRNDIDINNIILGIEEYFGQKCGPIIQEKIEEYWETKKNKV